MARAINRKTFSGRLVSPEEKITITEAVKMYTNYAAFAGFEEHEKGSLEVGKMGDLIIVSEDPWDTPDDQIENIKTLSTVLGGRVVHNISDF
jgi:predicted amidohydrolase YtcJ